MEFGISVGDDKGENRPLFEELRDRSAMAAPFSSLHLTKARLPTNLELRNVYNL
ncbi:hypothetical protein HPP92_026431 [Vanilla planifolia]|uniref:Uncharacterized protein n=1 Tax=Vanilla planifolia TaxID=51239 RepID=A0A835PCC4_VANPL|nr:hypothetical protein HPP92_026431 [Vanilla planifolia]